MFMSDRLFLKLRPRSLERRNSSKKPFDPAELGAALEQYLAENDWVKIEHFGHQLKGSSKAHGFSETSDLGAKIEECADIHDGSVARVLPTELQTVITEISRQQQEEHDGQ